MRARLNCTRQQDRQGPGTDQTVPVFGAVLVEVTRPIRARPCRLSALDPMYMIRKRTSFAFASIVSGGTSLVAGVIPDETGISGNYRPPVEFLADCGR